MNIDGHLLVLVASHIGINNNFELGKYSRLGQERNGCACGAAVAALQYCDNTANQLPTHESLGANPYDYQMSYLISEIAKRKHLINDHTNQNDRQAELAKQTYSIAQV